MTRREQIQNLALHDPVVAKHLQIGKHYLSGWTEILEGLVLDLQKELSETRVVFLEMYRRQSTDERKRETEDTTTEAER